MPSLVVYSNPQGELAEQEITLGEVMSERVYQLKYEHSEDDNDYFHDFDEGVEMIAVESEDGEKQILLRHADGLPLWEEFE